MVNPIALAVRRLMTSSNLLCCWTGRSPGFSPRRIDIVWPKALRWRQAQKGDSDEVGPIFPFLRPFLLCHEVGRTRMKTWLVVLYLGKSVAVAASFGAPGLCASKTEDCDWLRPAAAAAGRAVEDVTLDCVRSRSRPTIGEAR